jgi:hypothetical protein
VDFARNVVVPFNLLERARAIAAFGTPIDKIMQRANVSKAQAKRASAQAKRLPEGMKVPWRGGVLFVYSNLVGPSTFRFDGRRGGRLFFGLLNASSDSLTCRVLGPTNRKPSPPLWEGELEPESGLVVQLLPTFTGKYRVEFEGQAQLAVGEIAPAVDAVAQLRADGLYETYDGRVFTADGKPHRRLVAVV